jgi:DNA-directed RNA polymerase subunit RPC12/RpoP
MSRREENTGFICENCGKNIMPLSNGSYRNHCPYCLYSKHVDMQPGDRKGSCSGLMKPVGLIYKSGKGYQIVHRCLVCGIEKVNKISAGSSQPDDIDVLVGLVK